MAAWIVLDDGVYEAFIVWAELAPDPGRARNSLSVEAAVTSGPHKGAVLTLVASAEVAAQDPMDLIGRACHLIVVDGLPSLSI